MNRLTPKSVFFYNQRQDSKASCTSSASSNSEGMHACGNGLSKLQALW